MKNKHMSEAMKILWASAAINFISAILYVWSVISKALMSELNWTSKQASLPYTVLTISFVVFMVIFGKIIDSKGPKVPATVGSILIGTGLIFSGLTTSPVLMIITMGVLVGAGSGMINVATTATGVKWFPPEKKGMVTGIVVAGVGLSSAFYSPLSQFLINNIGISKTFIYLGLFVLITSIPLALMLKNPAKDSIKKDNKLKNINDNDRDWKHMLKDLGFYKMWLMLGFSSSAGLMIVGHISNIAKTQVNWEAGFILVIIISIFNTIGRLLGGSISDKMDRLVLVRIIFVIQGINMFMLSTHSNLWSLAMGVAIVGLCYGGGFSVFPAMVSDKYGAKNFGMNYAVLFTAWGLGGVIGPMTAAAILDSTGSYRYAYIISCTLLVISIAISLTVKKERIQ